jgi:addiction module HigA family antidote
VLVAASRHTLETHWRARVILDDLDSIPQRAAAEKRCAANEPLAALEKARCCHFAAMSLLHGRPIEIPQVPMARFGRRMHPGQVLREEYMEPMRLDAAGLARALGVAPCQIAPVIDDRSPMTSDLALRLALCFRTSPQFWLGLQTAYDLAMAQAQFGAEIEASVQPLAA